MNWLQGGPFLELSFIIMEPIQIGEVISKLQNIRFKIEVHNPPEYLHQYYEGYPYDEDDPHSERIHQITLNLTVHTTRKRRALLFVEKISSALVAFSICFYGDADDAPEWNQPGIRNDELDEFICLLNSIHSELEFNVGCLALEEDIKGLFDVNEVWPNEKYQLSNLNFKDNLNKFQAVLISQSLQDKLPDAPYTRVNHSGLLYKSALRRLLRDEL
ncbi:hypothetical protein [Paenibacillus soyae]|uniref:Uncharacterized protein n=1 Tax=Paenibacillus soyae TaxID=2969249 RepID=A0A9X2MW01_9BACL|nr:hypothetical protein [Paenibacillus soyae]MCR2806851.1 hypothetical protein [Paenibacillus soyae]